MGPTNQTFLPLGEALVHAERCRNEGRLAEAEAVCRRVLEADPNVAEAENLLGVIAHQNGRLGEAIAHVERATELAPQVALFHANLGEMYRLAGSPKLAVKEARRALAITPRMGEALSNLGAALYDLGDFEEAAAANRRAVAARPEFALGHGNLGNALHALKRFDEAIASYRRAIALDPDYADAWANLGTTLHHAGEFEEGVAVLRHAIALAPEHANAHCGLGILLLMRGEFAEGLDEYEWRLRSSERKGPRFPVRPWQGESLAGKHIYVEAEQGFGDTLQFVRYLPLLAARGARVSFRMHQELSELMRESLPGIKVLGDRGDPGPHDCDAVLLSLPFLFRTRLETIPAQVPYLRPPADAIARWQKRLAAPGAIKVGLVWAGNPKHANDMRRSLELKALAPLFAVPGTNFVSLQVGPRAADARRIRELRDLSKQLTDFTETAAAVAALDLVITVDTSVAHLAGSLGKPVWVVLPWVTDWRWMFEREDNPWYPTMRLFRQQRGESHARIIGVMAEQLARLTRGDTAPLMPFRELGERRAARAAEIVAIEARRAGTAAPTPSASTGQLMIAAEQNRQHGFLADAEELCRRVLAAEPANPEAEHMLGIIAHQSGKLAQAIEHVRRAIALAPDVALYHANLGEMCRLAGRLDEAIAAGRRAIALDPTNAGAHSNLGIALFEQDMFEDALALHDRAIALQADFVQAHSNRGNALQRLKRFAEAEPSYRRAIELQPAFLDPWNNLGTCLRHLKRPEEAETVYRKALELGPNNPDTLDNLALAVQDLGRLDEAAELMRRALVIEQRVGKFHVHHAMVLLDQHRITEAEAAAGRALALAPDNHEAVNLMGRVAFERGELDAALAHYRRALALKPDFADAWNNIANALNDLGRGREAQEAYAEALRLDPDAASFYVNLADAKTFSPGDVDLANMEALAARHERLSNTDRLQLDFARGKAYADLRDYDRSFRHLRAGNAAKRAAIAYDEGASLALFDRIEATFSPELIAAKSGGGEPSAMPIFVIGMPRSGTTLIEQILASHPLVYGAGELATFHETVLDVCGPDGHTIDYPDFVPALNGAALRQLGDRYVASLRALASKHGRADAAYVTDKMPSNYYFAGLIHLALPNAAIIHTIRDPVDTCLSCFSKLFSAEQNHTYDLAELGRYYKRYAQLMAHWRSVLPARRILDVRYEDVVADLEGEARRIVAHCGLPWDARCLSFHKTDRPVRTASASQVRQPIYNSAVGRWRVYEQHLGPLLAALGASPESANAAEGRNVSSAM
jgi:tetratricopeptide (TPR) repeat protein